jgi:hypothetical protein
VASAGFKVQSEATNPLFFPEHQIHKIQYRKWKDVTMSRYQ